MKKFIAKSQNSKQALKIAQMSSKLPVNVIILGQIGVGKKLLAKEILQDIQSYDAQILEELIIAKKINLDENNNKIIIFDIHKIANKTQFFQKLKGVKIVATSFDTNENFLNNFAVKINILPLEHRYEDLEELKKNYIKEARKIYAKTIIPQNIKIDLSGNGITLKQSIYKSILLKSLTKPELMDTLYDFFIKEFKVQRTYKELLAVFEIPLLKASKTAFNSQLQMAKKLKINRITLRKKLNYYFGQ
jgi:DNA-binding NtrC family response regulator